MNSQNSSTEKSRLEPSLPIKAQELAKMLDAAVTQKQITAWSVANRRFALSSFFADECEPPLEGNCDWMGTLHPTFDLASLTKPLFVNSLLRRFAPDFCELVGMRLTDLLEKPGTPAGEILRVALKANNSELTLADVLNHRTGVPPWMWFGKGAWHFPDTNGEIACTSDCLNTSQHQTRFEETLTRFAAKRLGKKAQADNYSDIGFFLLARIAENMPFMPDWKTALNTHNSALGTQFFHGSINPQKTSRAMPAFPYTVMQGHEVPDGAFQKREFGHVHDTNANIIAHHGIVSGHAGLFGTALDVLIASQFLASSQDKLINEKSRDDKSRFVFGLDTPSSADSAAGPREWPLPTGKHIFGHLGYTGTMFWFDVSNPLNPQHNVLLTNRTVQRTVYGSQNVPRILIFTELPQTDNGVEIQQADKFNSKYFVQKKLNQPLREISRNDAEEIIVAHSVGSTRIWNDSVLRKAPNIQTLRNAVSKIMWES
jgi:hypothetical protein